MSISVLNRIIIRLKSPKFSVISRITLSSIAETYYTHLNNHPQNPEKTLIQISPNLDAKCVSEVLKRFSNDNPEFGLRFFIWAGVQSKYYRHSQYMYNMACNLLQISQKPGRIRDVFYAYKDEGCVVSVKLVKVVLNLCKEGRICDEALWVLRKMKEFNCRPDTSMYNVVIGLFCEEGDVNVGVDLMREMKVSGLYPDMITYMAILKGLCRKGRLEDACLLCKEMKGNGCVANLVAYSALLHGLCRFGCFERAFEVLGEMEKEGGKFAPNVITYTLVIQSLCENGKAIDALNVLERMGRFNCSPNRITVNVLVKGLCDEGRVDEAFELVRRIGCEGSVPSGECYSSLVTSLLNVERIEDAEKLFRWMLSNDLRPDGLSCSILLKKMCANGRFLDAFHLLEDVEKKAVVVTIDSDIYSVILVRLCQRMNVVEVEKLSDHMIDKRIQVKNSYIEDIKKHFKITRIQSLAKLCKMDGECWI